MSECALLLFTAYRGQCAGTPRSRRKPTPSRSQTLSPMLLGQVSDCAKKLCLRNGNIYFLQVFRPSLGWPLCQNYNIAYRAVEQRQEFSLHSARVINVNSRELTQNRMLNLRGCSAGLLDMNWSLGKERADKCGSHSSLCQICAKSSFSPARPCLAHWGIGLMRRVRAPSGRTDNGTGTDTSECERPKDCSNFASYVRLGSTECTSEWQKE